jgi:LPS-assembly protein
VIRRSLLFLPFLGCALAAAPDMTSGSADRQETSLRTGETVWAGHAHLDYGDLRLTADEIRFNPKTHVAIARGHAIITRGSRRLLADEITYHTDTGEFETGDVRMGDYPVYLAGSSAQGTIERVRVDNASVTVPEPGLLVPTLHAARLFFSTDRKLHAEHASIGVGSIRPVALSGLEHDARRPLISNVSVTGGFRRSLGVYAEATLHVPLNDDFNLGADLGLYSSRGLMLGPSGSYDGTRDLSDFQGSFHSGFIHDYGDRLTDVLGRPVQPNRGFVEWEHQQHIGDRLTISGELNYWRDSEVVRDFRPREFFRVQEPDTYVDSTYAGDNYFVSLFARFQPNSFQVVQQRLPELRFDLLPLALGGGLYEQFNASVVALQQDALPVSPAVPTPDPERRSNRLDAYYGLSRPVRPTDWLTFTPVAGGRLTYYTHRSGTTRPVNGDYTRVLGEIGFDAEMHASAVFDYKNPQWKIDGLRHLLTPRVSYRYIPEADKGTPYIPQIDRQSFSTYLQPLGLGTVRNIDDLHATNTLRIGLDNTLQTRDPVYGSRDLVRLNIANDFRFERLPRQRKVSEIHSELAVMPARWLELGVYQSFAPQDFTLREFNTGVTLRDGDDWTVRFSSNFLRDESLHRGLNDYFLQGEKRLNEVYDAVVHLRYDARLQQFIEQIYGIRQIIGNTWRIEYAVSLYGGQRRESHFGLNVRVDAVRF